MDGFGHELACALQKIRYVSTATVSLAFRRAGLGGRRQRVGAADELDRHVLAAAIRAGVKLDFVFVGEGEPAADRRRYEDGYTVLRDAELAPGDRVTLPTPAVIVSRFPKPASQ